MAGLVPANHDFIWQHGKDVDGRDEHGHDVEGFVHDSLIVML
jgi:hypothetical protein